MAHPQESPVRTTTYLVERYWPGVTRPELDAAIERVRRALAAPLGEIGPVEHVASLLVDVDEVVFCLFSAPSREAVEAVNAQAGFPLDRIVEGTWLVSTAADAHTLRRPRNRRRSAAMVAGLGILSALLLGACGAGAPPAPAAGSGSGGAGAGSAGSARSAVAVPASTAAIDQCTLLTTAQIESATGLKVVRSGPDPIGLSRCMWTLSGDGRKEIGLSVDLDDPRAPKDQEFECKVGFGLDPVAGLGDTACGGSATGGEYWLHVLRGDDRITLRGGLFDERNQHAVKPSVWTTLARNVLAKLP